MFNIKKFKALNLNSENGNSNLLKQFKISIWKMQFAFQCD